MKKPAFVLFCLFLFPLSFAQKTLVIKPVEKPVLLDGVINSSDPWVETDWVSLEEINTFATTYEMYAKFQMKYDGANLYFAAVVNDSTRFTGYPTTFLNDYVWFLIAMDTTSTETGYYKSGDFSVSIQAIGNEDESGYGWDPPAWPNATFSFVDNGVDYVQEWKIPWSDLTPNMESIWDQKQFKWDLIVTDATSDGNRTQMRFWNDNSDEQWHNTWHFGLVTLSTPLNQLNQNNESDVLFDFEIPMADTSWYHFGNGTSENYKTDLTVVNNPSPSIINNSQNVLKFIVHDDAVNWVGMWTDYLQEPITLTEESHTLYMMVNKSFISPCALKLENSFDGGSTVYELKVSNTQIDQWEILEFDCSAGIGYSYTRLIVFPDFPDTRYEGGGIVYLDNISQSGVAVPVNFHIEAGADKSVFCGESVQLNPIINYNGSGSLTYSWSPAGGLSSSDIKKPMANPSVNTQYTLTVTSPDLGVLKDSVMIYVNPMNVYCGADRIITCGDRITLNRPDFNSSGTYSYLWSPSTGLSSATAAEPTVLTNETITYTVTVTSTNGCSGSDDISINVNPLEINAYDGWGYCRDQAQIYVTVNYSGIGPMTFNWTPADGLNATNVYDPLVTVTKESEYSITVNTPEGCTASALAKVYPIGLAAQPSICMVTVDENNKNVVVINKNSDSGLDSFIIYRESTERFNQFDKIGSIPYEDSAVFTDSKSDARVQSYRYRISIKDQCESETYQSETHKTIHLIGIGTNGNLIWEHYQGIWDIESYRIYRGTTPEDLKLIGSTSAINNSFTDVSFPSGMVYYQVEAVIPEPCSTLKSSSYSGIRSNLYLNGKANGIKNNQNPEAIFYPNPANDVLYLRNISPSISVAVFDPGGRILIDGKMNDNQIDISMLDKGMYLLKLTDQNEVITVTFIKK